MKRLQGQVAVITGAGRGIGRAIAVTFAREGASVVVSSRTRSEVELVADTCREMGAEAHAITADAMDRTAARQPIVAALDHFGQCDILVNNVGGVAGWHDSCGGGDDSFEATVVLSLHSTWWATSAALPAMLDRGFGRIINIGSTESLHANAGCPPAYVAAKHAIAGLTKQLAQDIGARDITVNCICPGWTHTSMVDFDEIGRESGVTAEVARADAARQASQNCILEPEEIAATAVFLASADAARITGQIISVDGGYRL